MTVTGDPLVNNIHDTIARPHANNPPMPSADAFVQGGFQSTQQMLQIGNPLAGYNTGGYPTANYGNGYTAGIDQGDMVRSASAVIETYQRQHSNWFGTQYGAMGGNNEVIAMTQQSLGQAWWAAYGR